MITNRAAHGAVTSLRAGLKQARRLAKAGNAVDACGLFDQLLRKYPDRYTEILDDAYAAMKPYIAKSRYEQYQARFVDFAIPAGAKVLDIGSGHLPFPLATHLADIALADNDYGRAGMPLREVAGKPLYECNIERMPFGDKEFDFVYCSHVLEHVADPERACGELMRVGRRGYIETPKRATDLFFNTAKISGHRWSAEAIDGGLQFTEYSPVDVDGLDCSILLDMNSAPQTRRERAFAALMLLRADRINTMLMWDGPFRVEIRRRKKAA